MFTTSNQIPDDCYRPKIFPTFLNVLFKGFMVLLWIPISLSCLPLFLLGVFVWGLPPIVSVPSRFCRYFNAVFTEGKPQDNIPFMNRILIFMLIFDTLVKAPVRGVCWFLDELLYPAYHKVSIKEPVFFISGPRSGSSQLCKYLEKDQQSFVIPTAIEGYAPYIWAWKLIVPIFKRLRIKAKHSDELNIYGAEAKKRHIFTLFTSDTWDTTVFGAFHFNQIILYLGVSFMKWGYPFARLQQPIDEDLYINNFITYTDCVLRKVMYYRGTPAQRVLIKGHCLLAAQALEEKYPKAKFFVVVRQPTERICSFINLAKVLCIDGPELLLKPGLFPPSWRIIRDYVIATQIPYCEQEMSFYRKCQANKLIIPFTLYMNNLSATLQSIYSLCDIPIPDHVVSDAVILQKTTHNPTTYRPNYDREYDRSLASLGVDEEKIKEHLSEYIEWINALENCKKTK